MNIISKEQTGGIQMGFKEGFFWGGATAANQYEMEEIIFLDVWL